MSAKKQIILMGNEGTVMNFLAANRDGRYNVAAISLFDKPQSTEPILGVPVCSTKEALMKTENPLVVLLENGNFNEAAVKFFEFHKAEYCHISRLDEHLAPEEPELLVMPEAQTMPDPTPVLVTDPEVTPASEPVAPVMPEPVAPVMPEPVAPVMPEPVAPVMPEPVAPVMPEPEQPRENAVYLTDEQFELLRGRLDSFCNDALLSLRNTKQKEFSIYSLNKELQKFKDGYFNKLLSPLVSDIITLREDCKNSVLDLEKYDLPTEDQKNYLNCTIEQIDNLFINHGVDERDGAYYFAGVRFYPSYEEAEQSTAPADDFVAENKANEIKRRSLDPADHSLEAIISLLDGLGEDLMGALRDADLLAKTVADQHEANMRVQAQCDGLILKPVLVKLIKLKAQVAATVAMIDALVDQSKSADVYLKCYEIAIDHLEALLLSLDVRIKDHLGDDYDPKTQKILKMVKLPPEEAHKDKKVQRICTDCYMIGEKVIYPSKVIVYKI